MKKQLQRKPLYRRKGFLWPAGVIASIIIVVLLAFRLSPWPGAMIIRAVFTDGANKMLGAMEAHTPSKPITVIANQQYRAGDNDALLDVYYPEAIASSAKLPVIIWTHGGAWISGSKANDVPYFKLLAAKGYVVVAPNYSLGPEKTYPTAVYQLNDAYTYIQKNQDRFHINKDAIILAGDSAGSQLSAQMATIVTNPAYAAKIGILPALKPSQLKGMVLNCGIYNMQGLTHPAPTASKLVGWGVDVTVWAYTGTRDLADPSLREMSPLYHATKEFPPTYISGGNGDPLTNAQSKPFAAKLQTLGVPVTTLFYAADHQPSLPHEYQFNLDNNDGKRALGATIDFIRKHIQ